MATVQVDLSEYDMLRESRNKALEEVKELKETIRGLKDKSRVILTTEYIYPTINHNNLCDSIVKLIQKAKEHDKDIEECRFTLPQFNLYEEVNYIIQKNIGFKNRPFSIYTGVYTDSYSSSQYIGFEDVKSKVEAHYRKDIDKAIANYKESEEEYNRRKDSVEDKVREEYSNIISKLKEDNKALQDRIAELSKSKEEKIAELMATINEARAKLEELSGTKKKGLFNKIFG